MINKIVFIMDFSCICVFSLYPDKEIGQSIESLDIALDELRLNLYQLIFLLYQQDNTRLQ